MCNYGYWGLAASCVEVDPHYSNINVRVAGQTNHPTKLECEVQRIALCASQHALLPSATPAYKTQCWAKTWTPCNYNKGCAYGNRFYLGL